MAAREVAGQPAASLSTDTASRLVKRSLGTRLPLRGLCSPPPPHASTHPAPSPGSPAPSPAASWVQCGGWVSGRGESASPPVASSVVWGPTQESRSTATRQSPCTASARGCRLGGPDRLSPRGAATARAPPARCPPPDLGWGWARVIPGGWRRGGGAAGGRAQRGECGECELLAGPAPGAQRPVLPTSSEVGGDPALSGTSCGGCGGVKYRAADSSETRTASSLTWDDESGLFP